MYLLKKPPLFFLVLILIFLSGCSASKQLFPSQTTLPTSTSTVIPPTSSPTLTPTVTATPHYEIGSTKIRQTDGMTMVFVPEGEFEMGSSNDNPDEQPVHTVYLDSYWIDQTEVTNVMYERCVDAGVCSLPRKLTQALGTYFGISGFGNFPVVYVNWTQADSYCQWAGGQLPTEAEGEKAARGTDASIYPWGNTYDRTLLNHNRGGVIYSISDVFTEAVGSYRYGGSPYGALDMAGNVWEWVADWYDESYYSNSPSNNPNGPDSGVYRVFRGGAYYDKNDDVRTSYRKWALPGADNGGGGFRCAVSH